MLQIENIVKVYKTGALVQTALKNVSLNLRDNEFVSILGPSGSGKTTLLNIIGGLDHYDEGDLKINGVSTKEYTDRDWDAYRNHSIGFVFQNYSLIPHLSILANVELALTIGGLSGSERRKKAEKALEEVGLADQMHKKPGQLSGGQMQRVAIARALVNDPDILLADEPTGALDTETSLQIMELLKRVAQKRLVVMVTHNPELAEKYSTRIIRLKDGEITGDSDPFLPGKGIPEEVKPEKPKKAGMSFLSSLSLSFNNLMTKKGRTFLTSLAGSIGIIGIALILSLSNGVNQYIDTIQKDTMESYPITINARSVNMEGMMAQRNQMMGSVLGSEENPEKREGIYADYSGLEQTDALTTVNNLTSFKKYLDDPDSEIHDYLGENGIIQTYDVPFAIYSWNSDDQLISTSADPGELDGKSSEQLSAAQQVLTGTQGSPMASMMSSTQTTSGAGLFYELIGGSDGRAVSSVMTDCYELLYGAWPQNDDEVILFLNEDNSISADAFYQLGLMTKEEYTAAVDQMKAGEEPEELVLDYQNICDHPFYLVTPCDQYVRNEDGTFSLVSSPSNDQLLENSLKLKVTGVVRPLPDAPNASIPEGVGYTTGLTRYVINHAGESEIITAQEAQPDRNVLTGIRFQAQDEEEKTADAKTYLSSLNVSDKAAFYKQIVQQNAAQAENVRPRQDGSGRKPADLDESAMADALDRWLEEAPDETVLLSIYDEYVGGSSLEDNLKTFGQVNEDTPSSISIYTDSFEDKQSVSDCIAAYNRTVEEENQITYTDYVELMTSSLTSIIDAISGILIAFVAVSLLVSCIMIGIVTHISVLERTREIGILRSLGASRRNISQVFNAETFIIGCCSGLLGVGISALLTIPINALVQNMLGADLSAALPLSTAVILIVLSILITVAGGLLPAGRAARKDPVAALRSE